MIEVDDEEITQPIQSGQEQVESSSVTAKGTRVNEDPGLDEASKGYCDLHHHNLACSESHVDCIDHQIANMPISLIVELHPLAHISLKKSRGVMQDCVLTSQMSIWS